MLFYRNPYSLSKQLLCFCLVLATQFAFGQEIPVKFQAIELLQIHIQTTDSLEILDDQEYVTATLRLKKDDALIIIDEPLKIRTRGNSTSSFPKRPYQLKFYDKQRMVSMPADKRWVLLANYSDKTMLRNSIGFALGHYSQLDFTPMSKHVELFINNQYQGLYLLAQKVEESKNRVDLSEDGFLIEVELENRIEEDDSCFSTSHETYCIKYPEISKKDNRFAEIKKQVTEIEESIYNFTTDSSGVRSYEKYLDVESVIDWYLINEITKNNDAKFHTSVFMSKAANGKLKLGPVWDFDISMGNIDYNGNMNPEGFWVKKADWFKALFKDPQFAGRVRNRFFEFYDNRNLIFELIDNHAHQLREAQIRDDQQWNIIGTKVWPNYKVFDTYQEEVDYLKDWLETRYQWLDAAYRRL
ncbi:CotH kinase family protein [Nonlabens ponticola]|uniref:Spore coat protein CotH n=1 Tax=Nonlabens ponticola TaxID=2496866 RepID=A0A3S9MYV7_9FLAO|nr:CotH kinase family protein [Nonlabens ponticola]AZQ44441.1 hypothetical protein EJ995_09365 [Nonlabens ponticola]